MHKQVHVFKQIVIILSLLRVYIYWLLINNVDMFIYLNFCGKNFCLENWSKSLSNLFSFSFF